MVGAVGKISLSSNHKVSGSIAGFAAGFEYLCDLNSFSTKLTQISILPG